MANFYFDANDTAGVVVVSNNNNAQLLSDPRITGKGSVKDLQLQQNVILSGWIYENENGAYFFLEGDYWCIAPWQIKNFSLTNSKVSRSSTEAQNYLNNTLFLNKQILENNLICAKYSHKLTQDERKMLYILQSRLEARNEVIVKEGLVQNVNTGSVIGYDYLNDYLNEFMRNPGIGLVISTTTALVLSAIIIGSIGTACYFAFKATYEEALNDVKFSKSLTKILTEKLTDEEYQQLKDETAGLITKSVLKEKLGSSFNIIKYIAIFGVGIVAIPTINKLLNRKDK